MAKARKTAGKSRKARRKTTSKKKSTARKASARKAKSRKSKARKVVAKKKLSRKRRKQEGVVDTLVESVEAVQKGFEDSVKMQERVGTRWGTGEG